MSHQIAIDFATGISPTCPPRHPVDSEPHLRQFTGQVLTLAWKLGNPGRNLPDFIVASPLIEYFLNMFYESIIDRLCMIVSFFKPHLDMGVGHLLLKHVSQVASWSQTGMENNKHLTPPARKSSWYWCVTPLIYVSLNYGQDWGFSRNGMINFFRRHISLRRHSVSWPWYICAVVCPKTNF